MKNIFIIKSLLFFIMVLILFSTNKLLNKDNSSKKRGSKSLSKSHQKSQSKTKRMKKTKKGKRRSRPLSIKPLSQITPADIEKALEKTVMPFDPQIIYNEGLSYIESENGDTKSDDTIAVGNYHLIIPNDISKEDAKEIMGKMTHLLILSMSAGANEQFNLNALAAPIEEENDYQEIFNSNNKKVLTEIQKSDFYNLTNRTEIRDFIKRAIILELKTVLNPSKKGFFSRFKPNYFNTPAEALEKFSKNNHIFKDIELLKNLNIPISKESGLTEKLVYLISATAYYIKHEKDTLLKSKLFEDMIHAISIPLGAKIEMIDEEVLKINHIAQKEMRELYRKTLHLFDIKKVSGIEESKNTLFLIDSTAYAFFKKAAIGLGILAGTAALGFAGHTGYNYYKDEDKDKTIKGSIKKTLDQDLEVLKSGKKYASKKTKAAGKYIGDKYDDFMDWQERKRGQKGRQIERAEAAEKAAEIEANEKLKKAIVNAAIHCLPSLIMATKSFAVAMAISIPLVSWKYIKYKDQKIKETTQSAKQDIILSEVGRFLKNGWEHMHEDLQESAMTAILAAGTIGTLSKMAKVPSTKAQIIAYLRRKR